MMKNILLLFALLQAFALQGQVLLQGKVIASDGSPLIGATVMLKNTTRGVTTDDAGFFSIELPPGERMLLVSYVGYGSRELTVRADMSPLVVTLEEGVTLRESVVTALGITRSEKSLGYAVAQVDGEEIEKVRVPNIVNALSGRAAGVTVIGSSGGNIGGSARITIRGLRSMNGDNQPLFVVDGVPVDNSNFTNFTQILANGQGALYESMRDYGNAIQDLNPDDIDNISILKGQASAALYGSRGANGVVMITTKKGSKGYRRGLGVTVNSSLTIDRVSVFPKFQNKYGGGVDLLPRGYADNSGYYKIPYVELSDGDTVGIFSSFDLVPIYGVDESSGVRFAASTEEHFQHLTSTGNYVFYSGFGQNQPNLYFRDWNSWDAWDTAHFGQSRLWEAGDDPIQFFETGVTSSHNIAFDGGTDRSAFRLSYNRFDQKGIYPNSKSERNTLSFNGSLDLSDHLQSFVGVNYVNSATTGRSGTTYDWRGGFNPAQNFSQWWQTQLRFDDLKEYENPDGTMRTWNRQSADNPRPQYWDNPYWNRYKNYETDGRDRVFGHAGLTWKINNWLSVTGRALTDFYNEEREERIAVGSTFPSQYTQDLYQVAETNTDLIFRAEKYLSDKLSFSVFAGGNKLWRKVERNFGATIGGLNIPGIYRLQNSKERPRVENILAQKQIESLFGGLSLGLENMVFLDLTGRQDWSSALPEGDNGYFYPSASASFVFSELLHIRKMSFGKLRVGWAKVGSDTDPYNIYTTYVSNPNFGSFPNYTVSNTLNNVNLKPEQTASLEAGVDLRFFHDRLGLDLTVYSGKTTDQIIPLATSAATGFDRQFINAGEISNRGIEISLRAVPVHAPSLTWEIAFNFGRNRNEVVSILPEDASITNLPLAVPYLISINAFVGEPYGTILGTNYLFDEKGNKLIDPRDGHYLVSPGVMPIGNIMPDFTGGITNGFTWKNLTLSLFIDFRKGGDLFSFTNVTGRFSGLLAETAVGDIRENGIVYDGVLAQLDSEGNPVADGGAGTPSLLDDTYQSTGEKSTIAVSYDDNKHFGGGGYINKRDVYDGSFIKLREVSLQYALPKQWLSRAGIAEANISLVSRNLAILFKNLPHLDPDMAISTSNIMGYEGGAVPSTRSIGLNLNFRF